MPEITLTVSGSVGSAPTWGVTFDHAALVTAGRSRSDANDLYVRHTASGPLMLKAVAGANTAACTVDFIATTNTVGDTRYRIGFGDLGWQTSRIVAGAYSYAGSVTAASVPALTLPAPSHALPVVKRYDLRRLDYPDVLSPRVREINENPRRQYDCAWRDIHPEDWYAIRAWFAASKGGAGTGTAEHVAGSWRPMPGTLTLTQDTRAKLGATMVIEEVLV